MKHVHREFEKLWRSLFESPVHLDSALSKSTAAAKSVLAQIVPRILATPTSLFAIAGIPIRKGEPWTLSASERASWPKVRALFETLAGDNPRQIPRLPKMKATLDDYPPLLIEEWQRDWGPAATKVLAERLATPAPTTFRIRRHVDRTTAMKELQGLEGIKASLMPTELSPLGLSSDEYIAIMKSGLYTRGDLEIQDEGSQIMALFALDPQTWGRLLQPSPGPRSVSGTPMDKPPALAKMAARVVVDACSGAGGKALAMADAMGGRGTVFAYDTSVKKLEALRRRVGRAQLNNIKTLKVEPSGATGEGAESKFKHSADVVLVDAPCSGWGVLRRNPDLKWREHQGARDASPTRLPELQLQLLRRYSTLVKPGGILVYGVCTFKKSETLEVVDQFLSESNHFSALQGGYLGPDRCDGFFMQAMRCGSS